MNYQSDLFGDMSQGVVLVPMWIPQIGYSAGLVILLIAFVDELIHVAMGGARGSSCWPAWRRGSVAGMGTESRCPWRA